MVNLFKNIVGGGGRELCVRLCTLRETASSTYQSEQEIDRTIWKSIDSTSILIHKRERERERERERQRERQRDRDEDKKRVEIGREK